MSVIQSEFDRAQVSHFDELVTQVEIGARCFYCWDVFDDAEPAYAKTRDHVVPRTHGGTDDQLVAACRSCNSAKGTRDAQEFWESRVTLRRVHIMVAHWNVFKAETA